MTNKPTAADRAMVKELRALIERVERGGGLWP